VTERVAQPITADLVRLMREASGMNMPSCHEAAKAAQALYGGDYVVALLVKRANGDAVMIRSRDPAVDDREARRRRDLADALAMRPEVVARGGAWARLDEMSGVHQPEGRP
jgi:hypothetical protein